MQAAVKRTVHHNKNQSTNMKKRSTYIIIAMVLLIFICVSFDNTFGRIICFIAAAIILIIYIYERVAFRLRLWDWFTGKRDNKDL